jgi:hypothetical protein
MKSWRRTPTDALRNQSITSRRRKRMSSRGAVTSIINIITTIITPIIMPMICPSIIANNFQFSSEGPFHLMIRMTHRPDRMQITQENT